MFKLFTKKPAKDLPEPMTNVRVVLEGQKPPALPLPAATTPKNGLEGRLLFQGMHAEINPSENVRTSSMTCPSCTTSFRHFLNSDGKKTVVKCPGCSKVFRV